MFDNSRVSEVNNHRPNYNYAETKQKSGVSVSDICKRIINFLRDKSIQNENEEPMREMNSFLLQLSEQFFSD